MGDPRLSTERVQSGNGRALFVALSALLVLGLFVWKPWDAPTPRPTEVALEPTAAPTLPGDQPSATEPPTGPASTPAPTASPGPLPPPDLAPLRPLGEFVLASADGSPLVDCEYGARRGARRYLTGVQVQPPLATVVNPRGEVLDIKQLAWRFELQLNQLDTVFDEDWQTIARSRRQIAAPVSGRPVAFRPLTLDFDARDQGDDAVFRVVVIGEWYTRNIELAGMGQEVATTYQEGNRPDEVRYEGCPGVRRAG